jgi:hypothetical protein
MGPTSCRVTTKGIPQWIFRRQVTGGDAADAHQGYRLKIVKKTGADTRPFHFRIDR